MHMYLTCLMYIRMHIVIHCVCIYLCILCLHTCTYVIICIRDKPGHTYMRSFAHVHTHDMYSYANGHAQRNDLEYVKGVELQVLTAEGATTPSVQTAFYDSRFPYGATYYVEL